MVVVLVVEVVPNVKFTSLVEGGDLLKLLSIRVEQGHKLGKGKGRGGEGRGKFVGIYRRRPPPLGVSSLLHRINSQHSQQSQTLVATRANTRNAREDAQTRAAPHEHAQHAQHGQHAQHAQHLTNTRNMRSTVNTRNARNTLCEDRRDPPDRNLTYLLVEG